MTDSDAEKQDSPPPRLPRLPPMAWLCHAVDARHLAELAPSLAHLTDEALEEHFESLGGFANPAVMSCVEVQSRTGAKALLYPILLPVTSQWMKRRIESRRRQECRTLVQKGVELARYLDCGLVALGQYTSIATRNGRSINSYGMGVTTGNSYAAALAIQGINRALRERSLKAQQQTLVIVGAAGNIGRACAEILAPDYRQTILLGSRKGDSRQRLQDIADVLPRAIIATEPDAIVRGDVVLVSTNSVTAPLGASHFKADAIVCDVSVPANLHARVAATRPDLEILTGGIARLPRKEDLHIQGFPLPAGYTLGCMAEGILLSFESMRDNTFTGLLSAPNVKKVEQLASRHGFELAEPELCKLSSRAKEASVNACE